jgi:hypothetical protein
MKVIVSTTSSKQQAFNVYVSFCYIFVPFQQDNLVFATLHQSDDKDDATMKTPRTCALTVHEGTEYERLNLDDILPYHVFSEETDPVLGRTLRHAARYKIPSSSTVEEQHPALMSV